MKSNYIQLLLAIIMIDCYLNEMYLLIKDDKEAVNQNL